MDLPRLPTEVLEDQILPHVKWNDLLRLRRVSKEFKNAVGVYVNKHPELAPEIEIREEGSHDRTLKHFLELGIPSQKFYLNNKSGDGEDFYKTNYVFKGRFLKQFGSKLTHLRVQNFNLHCAKEEKAFLQKLTNLRSFVAEQVNLKIVKVFSAPPNFPAAPSVFQHLKTLILKRLTSNPREYDVTLSLHECLAAWKSLEQLVIPVVPECNADYMSNVFRVLESHIKMRSKAAKKGDGTVLKAVDFGNLTLDKLSVGAYRDWAYLAQTCVLKSVEIWNCRCAWFQEGIRSVRERNLRVNLGATVVSMACEDFGEDEDVLWLMEMPNLESLNVESTYKLATALGTQRQNTRPNWPKLKCLDVTLFGQSNPQYMKAVYGFLFRGVLHQNLKELTLRMAYYEEEILNRLINCLIVSCPNLSKLTLVNWPRDEAVTRIWEGLPRLEELILDNCGLTDGFFMGRDHRNPAFLKLRNLKKLTLKNLKKVVITELLFSNVFRHMHLTHLTLSYERVYCRSHEETGNVSVDAYLDKGLQSLVGGPFAESIEVLKLLGSFVPSVSPTELQSILNQFRSSNF